MVYNDRYTAVCTETPASADTASASECGVLQLATGRALDFAGHARA